MVGNAVRLVAVLLFLAVVAAGCNKADRLPDPFEAGWQGKPVCELVHEDHRLRVLQCTFEPGVGHERHFHDPHFGYAIAGGLMRITDENGVRELDVPTASSFSSEGVAWHEVLNVGDTTAIFLIIELK